MATGFITPLMRKIDRQVAERNAIAWKAMNDAAAPEPEPEPEPPVEPEPDPAPKWMPTSVRILREVAARHEVTPADIRGRCRRRKFTHARQEWFWEMSRQPGWSLPRIGQVLGGFDHTTVLHGIRRHQARLDEQEAHTMVDE